MPLGHWSGRAAAGNAGAVLDAVARRLLAERDRWPLWLPVALAAGIGVYFSLDREPPVWSGTAVAALGVALLLAFRRRPWAGVVFALWIAAALGFTAAQVRTDVAGTDMITGRIGPVTVTGTAVDLVKRRRGWRLIIERPVFASRRPVPAMKRLRLSLRRDPGAFAPGSRVRIRAVLLPIPPPVAPGAFDFQRQAFFRGIGATGFAIGPLERLAPAPVGWWDGIRFGIEQVRAAATSEIQTTLGGDRGAVATALLTGRRDRISAETMAAIRDSGLAHLLAISGLHVGLVVGSAFFLLRLLLALWRPVAARHHVKKWAAAGALVVGLGYVLLAGAPIPTQRAFLMIAVVMVAVMIDRIGISMRLVAAAAAALLLVSPEVIVEPGFQMSFAAVIGLIAVYEALRDRAAGLWRDRAWRRRLLLWAGGILLTSLVAGLATAPFAVFHFNRFTGYGVAANMLAVPITAFWVMPLGLIALVLMPLGLAEIPLVLMGWGIEAILTVAREVASWPGAVALVPSPSAIGLVILSAGALWLALWRRPWRLAGMVLIAAGAATAWLTPRPDVLVSPGGRLAAFRMDNGGLAVSSARRAAYVATTWVRREGRAGARVWPSQGAMPGLRLRCDGEGCTYRRNSEIVAFARSRVAAAEDCYRATVVIALVPVRGACPAPRRVIDLYDLRDFGAHAIWLGPDGPAVVSDRAHRGARPWVALPPVRARRVSIAARDRRGWERPRDKSRRNLHRREKPAGDATNGQGRP